MIMGRFFDIAGRYVMLRGRIHICYGITDFASPKLLFLTLNDS